MQSTLLRRETARPRPRLTERSGQKAAPIPVLIASGVALELLLLLMFVGGSHLGWYPSRLGSAALWIENNLLQRFAPLFSGSGDEAAAVAVAIYSSALIGTFVVYALALLWAARAGKGSRTHLWIILGFAGLFAGSLVLQPYLASQDIFSYAFYAKIMATYGHNPYVEAPRNFPFDPLFEALYWKDQASNYGPFWTYLSSGLALVTGPAIAASLASLKGTVALFCLLGAPLVWSILGQVSPGNRVLGTLLYAWNPLIVVEASGNGHNDAMMTFFLLLWLWLHIKRRPMLAVGALVAAVLTKYVAAVLLPLYLLLLLRRAVGLKAQAQIVLGSGLVGLALTVAAFLPIYTGPETFQIVGFGSGVQTYINSPMELVFRELRVALGEPREIATLPLRFHGYWVATNTRTVLRATPTTDGVEGVALSARTSLLVVEDPLGSTLHVYQPDLDRLGYVPAGDTFATTPPEVLPANNRIASLEDATRSPYAQRANSLLRAVTTVIYLLIFLALARGIWTLSDLITASLLLLLASYWLIETWFWPWYVVWAVPFAALRPRSRLSALTIVFCLTALTLDIRTNVAVVPGLNDTVPYRAIAIFGLPVLLTGLALLFERSRRRQRQAREAAAAEPRLTATPPRPALSRARLVGLSGQQILASPHSWFLPGIGLVAAPLLAALLVGFSFQAPSLADGPSPSDTSLRYLAWSASYRDGLEHLQARQLDQAIEAFSDAARERPDILTTYHSRAEALMEANRYAEATADLTLLLSKSGEDSSLFVERGEAYLQTQRPDLAIQDFARAAELDPEASEPHRLLAQLYYDEGRLGEALAEQRQASNLDAADPTVYRELGDIYASLRTYDIALAAYDRSLELDAAQASLYAGRASVLRILGRPDQAILDLQQVLAFSRDAEERLWAERILIAEGVPPAATQTAQRRLHLQ